MYRTGMKIGYARVSIYAHDETSQRDALRALGVNDSNIYVDTGFTGNNRERPGLRGAIAAARPGDTLVAVELARLARSLSDAWDITGDLVDRGISLNLGGRAYDLDHPGGQLLFDLLGMLAQFQAELGHLRAQEGVEIARTNGRARGKRQVLTADQLRQLAELSGRATHTQAELAELFGVSRATIWRALQLETSHQEGASSSEST